MGISSSLTLEDDNPLNTVNTQPTNENSVNVVDSKLLYNYRGINDNEIPKTHMICLINGYIDDTHSIQMPTDLILLLYQYLIVPQKLILNRYRNTTRLTHSEYMFEIIEISQTHCIIHIEPNFTEKQCTITCLQSLEMETLNTKMISHRETLNLIIKKEMKMTQSSIMFGVKCVNQSLHIECNTFNMNNYAKIIANKSVNIISKNNISIGSNTKIICDGNLTLNAIHGNIIMEKWDIISADIININCKCGTLTIENGELHSINDTSIECNELIIQKNVKITSEKGKINIKTYANNNDCHMESYLNKPIPNFFWKPVNSNKWLKYIPRLYIPKMWHKKPSSMPLIHIKCLIRGYCRLYMDVSIISTDIKHELFKWIRYNLDLQSKQLMYFMNNTQYEYYDINFGKCSQIWISHTDINGTKIIKLNCINDFNQNGTISMYTESELRYSQYSSEHKCVVNINVGNNFYQNGVIATYEIKSMYKIEKENSHKIFKIRHGGFINIKCKNMYCGRWSKINTYANDYGGDIKIQVENHLFFGMNSKIQSIALNKSKSMQGKGGDIFISAGKKITAEPYLRIDSNSYFEKYKICFGKIILKSKTKQIITESMRILKDLKKFTFQDFQCEQRIQSHMLRRLLNSGTNIQPQIFEDIGIGSDNCIGYDAFCKWRKRLTLKYLETLMHKNYTNGIFFDIRTGKMDPMYDCYKSYV